MVKTFDFILLVNKHLILITMLNKFFSFKILWILILVHKNLSIMFSTSQNFPFNFFIVNSQFIFILMSDFWLFYFQMCSSYVKLLIHFIKTLYVHFILYSKNVKTCQKLFTSWVKNRRKFWKDRKSYFIF